MAFHNLCTTLMLFLLIDLPVRMSDLNLVSWNSDLVFWLNALYIGLETLTIYAWYIYFLTVQGSPYLRSRKLRLIITIPLDLMIVLLVVSYKTSWLFYVDANGTYTRGSLFALQFLLPYAYLFASLISTIRGYRRNRDKRMFAILFSSFLTSVVASILQIIYSGSFTHAGLCMAVLLVYIEMYQEEIKALDKMDSLKELNEQLESANEKLHATIGELEISIENEKAAHNAKNDFLSRMSHDIRTPLNGILGIIEINDRHPDDVALLAANRRKEKTAAKHLMSLVNDVLDMSKLSTGKYEFAYEPFVMKDIVGDALTITRPKAKTAGITLIDETASDTFDYPATMGSPLHVSRILMNIIGNGIKYNKPNGSVSVKLDHEYVGDTHIRYTISIADTGIGMSEAFIQQLFEPFSQERVDARSTFEGTGLGMTITKALVEKMGGTIEVKSKADVGSTFIVGLTFEIAKLQKKSEGEEAEEQSIEGLHILLVEDNDLNIEIANELLTDAGATVDTAENGRIAFDKFSQSPADTYDAILMDCMMPVWDGYTATGAIRALERADAKTIPIIAMTANAFADDVRKCLESGMDDHVSKPFEIDKVIRTIRKHVDYGTNGKE